MEPRFVCQPCDASVPLTEAQQWRCSCGAPWELPEAPPFDAASIDPGASGVWRYRAQIRLPADWSPISLGEGRAPWLRLRGGPWVACAHHEPTLSFKARGAAVLATWAREAGKEPLIEDSSGNAGAALAAYAAAAGMRSRIYVPASAPAGKRQLLEAVGAEVVAVPGPRPETTRAALEDTEGTYCSHTWNPLFLEGIKTMAFAWWEGGRIPQRIYVPAGQGSLVLGLRQGFDELCRGLPEIPNPAIVAVQHHQAAPLHEKWLASNDEPKPSHASDEEATTTSASTAVSGPPEGLLADGIASGEPVRKRAILRAVRESGGEVRVVDDEAILKAQRRLASNGLWVEPTAAVALAAHDQAAREDGEALAVLTGHGLLKPDN